MVVIEGVLLVDIEFEEQIVSFTFEVFVPLNRQLEPSMITRAICKAIIEQHTY